MISLKFQRNSVFRALLLVVGVAAACASSCSQRSDLGENVQSFQQALSSTGGQAGTQVDQVDLKFRLPNSVPLEQVVLSGESSVFVRRETQVAEPSRGTFTVSLGGVSTDEKVRLGSVAARGTVVIGNQATVTGDILSPVAPQIGDEAQVLGSVRKDSLSSVRLLTLKVSFPVASVPDVVVKAGQSRVLAAGAYSTIKVRAGGKVALAAGSYYLGTLVVDEGGEVTVPGGSTPVTLYVKTLLRLQGMFAGAPSPAPVLLAYLGSQPVNIEGRIAASVLAPNAAVSLDARCSLTGAVFAKSLLVDDLVVLRHRAFSWGAVPLERGGTGLIENAPTSHVFSFSFPFFSGFKPGSSAVVGRSQVLLNANSRIVGAGLGPVLVSGAGGVRFSAGVQVSGGVSTLGAVAQSELGSVVGSVSQGSGTIGQQKCTTIFSGVTHGDVLLRSGRAKILYPEAYGNVTVEGGAKLYLTQGTYYFASLAIEPQGQLIVGDGSLSVMVQSSLSMQGQVLKLGGGKPELFVAYAGTGTALLGGQFVGTLVAENSPVTVTAGASVTGNVAGSSVTLGAGAVVQQSPVDVGLVCNLPLAGGQEQRKETGAPDLLAIDSHKPLENKQGRFTPAAPIWFAIPSRLLVADGNAGNYDATLSYRTMAGALSTCTYRGGAATSHPITRRDLAAGTQYNFQSCTQGQAPLSAQQGSDFTLTIHGDSRFAVGSATIVRLSLQEGKCQESLGSFIPPAEAVSMFENFSWSRTSAVAENNPDGTPALYYANIYVKDEKERDLIDALFIHSQTTPLFQSEYPEDFAGRCGGVSSGGDGLGEWAFAVIPGAVYNRIRQLVVDTSINVEGGVRTLFDAVVLRAVPEIARNSNGSLKLDTLRAAGFQWRLKGEVIHELPDTAALGVTELGDGSAVALVVNAYEFVRNVAETVTRQVIQAITWLATFLLPDVQVNIDFDFMNPDARFNDPQGVPDVLRTHWGPLGGEELAPEGLRVDLYQVLVTNPLLGVPPMPTLYSQKMNRTGRVRFDIVKNMLGVTQAAGGTLCVSTENSAASIRRLVFPYTHCFFTRPVNLRDPSSVLDNPIIAGFSKNTDLSLKVGRMELASLAEFTDTHRYARDVLNIDIGQAKVLTELLADTFSSGVPWAPCMNVSGFSSRDLVDRETIVGALTSFRGLVDTTQLPISGLTGLGSSALAGSDIVLPSGTILDTTRGVATHEYGHFVFCTLLAQGTSALSLTGSPRKELFEKLFLQTIAEGDPSPSDDARTMNEGFADFIAAQVAGGTNYFPTTASAAGIVSFCDRKVTDPAFCLDENLIPENGGGTFAQIGRFTTTLHDAFDGHYANEDFTTSPVAPAKWVLLPNNADLLSAPRERCEIGGALLVPGSCVDNEKVGRASVLNGLQEKPDAALGYAFDSYGNRQDERVGLAGERIRSVLEHFLQRTHTGLSDPGEQAFDLEMTSMRSAVAETMREAGATWCDACRVLALHEPGGPLFSGAMAEAPFWEACLRSDFLPGLGQPPEAALVIEESTCSACGPLEFRSDVQCGSRVPTDGPCAPGSNGVTFHASRCLACPPGQRRVPGTNSCAPCGPGEVVDRAGSCTRCPVGLITTDGLTCTVCPLGASPNAAQTSCVSCPPDLAITLAPSCDNVVVQVPASHPGDACPDQAWIDVNGVAATLGWGVVVSPVPGASVALCPQTSISALAFVPSSSQVLANATASGVPCIPSGAIDLCQASCNYNAGLGSMPPNASGRIRLTSSLSLATTAYSLQISVPTTSNCPPIR